MKATFAQVQQVVRLNMESRPDGFATPQYEVRRHAIRVVMQRRCDGKPLTGWYLDGKRRGLGHVRQAVGAR